MFMKLVVGDKSLLPLAIQILSDEHKKILKLQ